MCGIVGYLGTAPAAAVLLHGLQRLAYRGYDSAGLTVLGPDGLQTLRRAGKLTNLEAALQHTPLPGTVGIGHTRWATHGAPTDANAHPHTDCTGRIAVVHNGIIENYQTLKTELEAAGHAFTSETDTEVLAHLIEAHDAGDLVAAVQAALRRVEGSYALAVVCQDAPELLVVTRQHSPLILGHGDGAYFVASDVPALLPHTRLVTYLRDGEVAALTPDGVQLWDAAGVAQPLKVATITWDVAAAEKGGYKHFMAKELQEQPTALAETLRGRLTPEGVLCLPELDGLADVIAALDQVLLIGCGTAYHAGLVGHQALEQLAGLPIQTAMASELRYRDPHVTPHTLAVVISQSGETADTLAALRRVKDLGAHVLAITNVVGSAVDRAADVTLYTQAGPEIAVASTKAYTTQLLVLFTLALALGEARDILTPDEVQHYTAAVRALPAQAAAALAQGDTIQACVERFHGVQSALYLGRGANYPTALEGALKLKEVSYIHAEGYAAGEMKHGPIALITPECPTVAVAVPGRVYDKMHGNLQEVRARRGPVIAVGVEGDTQLPSVADMVLTVPATEEVFSPLLTILPLQLLAYACAEARGCDIDQPRNLAKSVTVE
jgi:glucosamine--fructose-6-phosphate aminotransferase (isomerizing)